MKKICCAIISFVFMMCLTGCGHTHSYTQKDIDATCNYPAYSIYTCSCGDSYLDNYGSESLGHNFSDWYIKPAEDCSHTWKKERECLREGCLQVESLDVAHTSHKFIEGNCYFCGNDIESLSVKTYDYSLNKDGSIKGFLVQENETYDFYLLGSGKVNDKQYLEADGFASKVKNVYIDENISSFNMSIFDSCLFVQSFDLPSSITEVTFGSLVGIVKNNSYLYYNGNVENWCNIDFICGGLYNSSPFATIENICINNKIIIELDIPDSVNVIKDFAFAGYKNLTTVRIANSVRKIGNYAFYGASNLSSISLGNSIQSIGSSAFVNTDLFSNYNNWTNDMLIIDNYIVNAKSSISKATIGESIIGIADKAFKNCDELKEIIIPSTLKYMGKAVFFDCDFLQIYCEDASIKDTWEITWNIKKDGVALNPDDLCHPVIWNYKNN